MSTPTNNHSKDTYHHGDLRRALMDGALAVVRERGLDALSLREVAAAAGVSHAAPYHHFADKAALVRALGYEALGRLDERMATAEAAAADDPREQLLAIGMSYIAFCTERPEYFAVMEAPELRDPSTFDQAEPHGETWERLVRAVVGCQEAGLLPREDPSILAIGMWALVHGVTELWLTAPLTQTPEGAGGVGPLADRILRSMLGRATASDDAPAIPDADPTPGGTD